MTNTTAGRPDPRGATRLPLIVLWMLAEFGPVPASAIELAQYPAYPQYPAAPQYQTAPLYWPTPQTPQYRPVPASPPALAVPRAPVYEPGPYNDLTPSRGE